MDEGGKDVAVGRGGRRGGRLRWNRRTVGRGKKKKKQKRDRQKKKKGAQQDAPFCVGTVLLV